MLSVPDPPLILGFPEQRGDVHEADTPILCLGQGQTDVKHCAVRTTFRRDLAPMRFDDDMRDAQSHAHAVLLRSKERLEQPPQSVRWYPGPSIADRDKGLSV